MSKKDTHKLAREYEDGAVPKPSQRCGRCRCTMSKDKVICPHCGVAVIVGSEIAMLRRIIRDALDGLKDMKMAGFSSESALSCTDHCDYDSGRSCINDKHRCERYPDTRHARLIAKLEAVVDK